MDRRPYREIYLDYAASTPCDPAVVEAMLPYLVYETANPSSSHRAGIRAHRAVETARQQVADALGCFPYEVFFTSGATESNNLAILGCAAVGGNRFGIVTTPIEHKSILGPCSALAAKGYKLSFCPIYTDGRIDLGALADLLDDTTRLVSVQLANNEIGTIQPIFEVAQLVHRVGALLHVDAAQAFGKVPIDVDYLDVDLMSISAHKCYGPKGVGALYIRDGISSGMVEPILEGGGQERGIRPGTENLPAIVGFAKASELCLSSMRDEEVRVRHLRDTFEAILMARVPGILRNGAVSQRLPGASSLLLPAVDAEAVMANTPELAMSSSSACISGALAPSHVLTGIGLSGNEALRTLRVGLGRFSLHSEVNYAGHRVGDVIKGLQGRGGYLVPA